MSETGMLETFRPPTVFFIDDSATMREVMKIAFRRENISVVACHDAATALAQIEQAPPDAVITDVIMPDKDGFEVCQHIKQHPRLSKIPVLLLSGVVNREVAEKALNVKADELIRKPFQPQDLIARVKQLLAPKGPAPVAPATPANTIEGGERGSVLSGIFGKAPSLSRVASPSFNPPPAPAAVSARPSFATAVAPAPARNPSADVAKIRLEVGRLENLVKKLQSELVAEREYARALEAHVKTLQEND
jgi:CheY-like chemotaxis protein